MACEVCLGINSDRCPVCGREPRMKECPVCGGKGGAYWAQSVESDDEMEVTPTAYDLLPETRKSAVMMRYRWFKGCFEPCMTCGGTGEVEADEDFGPDPDDYYDRMREAREEAEQ